MVRSSRAHSSRFHAATRLILSWSVCCVVLFFTSSAFATHAESTPDDKAESELPAGMCGSGAMSVEAPQYIPPSFDGTIDLLKEPECPGDLLVLFSGTDDDENGSATALLDQVDDPGAALSRTAFPRRNAPALATPHAVELGQPGSHSEVYRPPRS